MSNSVIALCSRVGIEFTRYFLVSGAALVVDFGLFLTLSDAVGVYYLWAGAIGFCVGMVIAYLGSIYWAFAGRSVESRVFEFVVFAIVGVVGLGITEIVLWTGTDVVGLHHGISKIVATAFTFLFNFFVRKVLLFR